MVNFDRLRQISHSTSILSVLDFYNLEYFSIGNNRYKMVCPFHNDHDPSLVIYTSEDHIDESFCCYVDNIAGDSFHFIRKMEGNDFNKAWSVLCHINGILDSESQSIDHLDMLFHNKKQRSIDPRSVNKINYEISTSYRDLVKKNLDLLDEASKIKLLQSVDKRFFELDAFLSQNPSFAEMQLFFKKEIENIKGLQKQITSWVK